MAIDKNQLAQEQLAKLRASSGSPGSGTARMGGNPYWDWQWSSKKNDWVQVFVGNGSPLMGAKSPGPKPPIPKVLPVDGTSYLRNYFLPQPTNPITPKVNPFNLEELNQELARRGLGRIKYQPGFDWTRGQQFYYYIDPDGKEHNISGKGAGWMGVGENINDIPSIPGITVPDESGWMIGGVRKTTQPFPSKDPNQPIRPPVINPPLQRPIEPIKPPQQPINPPSGGVPIGSGDQPKQVPVQPIRKPIGNYSKLPSQPIGIDRQWYINNKNKQVGELANRKFGQQTTPANKIVSTIKQQKTGVGSPSSARLSNGLYDLKNNLYNNKYGA